MKRVFMYVFIRLVQQWLSIPCVCLYVRYYTHWVSSVQVRLLFGFYTLRYVLRVTWLGFLRRFSRSKDKNKPFRLCLSELYTNYLYEISDISKDVHDISFGRSEQTRTKDRYYATSACSTQSTRPRRRRRQSPKTNRGFENCCVNSRKQNGEQYLRSIGPE